MSKLLKVLYSHVFQKCLPNNQLADWKPRNLIQAIFGNFSFISGKLFLWSQVLILPLLNYDNFTFIKLQFDIPLIFAMIMIYNIKFYKLIQFIFLS